MDEASHKRKLVAEINALPGARARRVEDKWAVGVLDMIIKLPTVPVILAEGKLVVGAQFGPTPPQFIEGERWGKAGVTPVLIGWRNKHKEMYVSPWTQKAHIDECFGHTWGDWSYVKILMEYLDESRRNAA